MTNNKERGRSWPANGIKPDVSVNHEVRVLSSHRDQAAEALSFQMIAFQRNGFQVLKKDSPELQERHTYIAQRDRGRL